MILYLIYELHNIGVSPSNNLSMNSSPESDTFPHSSYAVSYTHLQNPRITQCDILENRIVIIRNEIL